MATSSCAALRAAIAFAAVCSMLPAQAATEKFVYLGAQPDGVEIFIQSSPAVVGADGRHQAWFRTVPKTPQPINDANGAPQKYSDMLAYNVADCAKRTMAAAAMIYRDDKQATVARFEILPNELELRPIKANSLGEAMLGRLCATAKKPAPAATSPEAPAKKSAGPVTSPATTSPFK
jgi:hypothetical protein